MPRHSGGPGGGTLMMIAGTSHPALAQAVSDRLGIPLCACDVGKFSAGETSVQIKSSVRDSDVFIISSPSPPCINDHVVETLVLIQACKTASARRITVVMPHYAYARDDKKDKARASITAKLHAKLIEVAGADHLISLDVHSPQAQGFFNIPMDNLSSSTLMQQWIKSNIPDWRDAVIVSPDAGGAKRAANLAERLNVELALTNRKRKKASRPHSTYNMDGSCIVETVPGTPMMTPSITSTPMHEPSMMSSSVYSQMGSFSLNGPINGSSEEDDRPEALELLVGDVKGKVVCIIDDMIETGKTMRMAVHVLQEAGAKAIYAIVTHALISDITLKNLEGLPLKRLVVTNSIDQTKWIEKTGGLIETMDISPLISESVRRTHNGESISSLFRAEAL